MASISGSGSAFIRPLTEADLPAALLLSASAHWNQNAADWRGMLALGQGWGIDAVAPGGERVLAASTVVLPYGRRFAWVSMVLVLPAFQRLGLASQLLRHALATLQAQGRAAVLDATPAGHAVYVQQGFVDTWGFARYARPAAQVVGAGTLAAALPDGAAPAPTVRALQPGDWPAIAALDQTAFGASRLPLLRLLAQRQPQGAWVLQEGARISGFVLARDGLHATQIGPLLAGSESAAVQLLAHTLAVVSGPVFADLLQGRPVLCAFLQSQGFALQRPFTRMVRGRKKAPGHAGALMLVAGPELG